jgi:hypothetical protein
MNASNDRERQREFARRTRARAKLQSNILHTRFNDLAEEALKLKQIEVERSTANILLGFLTPSKSETSLDGEIVSSNETETVAVAPSAVENAAEPGSSAEVDIDIAGMLDIVKVHLSQRYVMPPLPVSDDLTRMNALRKERNRLHAKQTRERQRVFLQTLANMVNALEINNAKLRKLFKIPDDPATASGSSAGLSPHGGDDNDIDDYGDGDGDGDDSDGSTSEVDYGKRGREGEADEPDRLSAAGFAATGDETNVAPTASTATAKKAAGSSSSKRAKSSKD